MAANKPPTSDGGLETAATSHVLHEDRLRVVGRALDLERFRAAIIVEAPEGVFVRATRVDKQSPFVRLLTDDEARVEVAELRRHRGGGERIDRHPLLPSGYEDFLRALGHWLDGQSARWISVHEFKEQIVVCAYVPRVTFRSTTLEATETIFGSDDIVALVDAAYHRRGTGRRSLIRRLINRPSE